MKINTQICEIWMHSEYDQYYTPLASRSGESQPTTNIFPGNKNTVSIKSTVALGSKISEKKILHFPV